MNFGQIVKIFLEAENTDQITLPDGKILFYNGEATTKKKTELAKQKALDIMI